jgi:hypothetical protein
MGLFAMQLERSCDEFCLFHLRFVLGSFQAVRLAVGSASVTRKVEEETRPR